MITILILLNRNDANKFRITGITIKQKYKNRYLYTLIMIK